MKFGILKDREERNEDKKECVWGALHDTGGTF